MDMKLGKCNLIVNKREEQGWIKETIMTGLKEEWKQTSKNNKHVQSDVTRKLYSETEPRMYTITL